MCKLGCLKLWIGDEGFRISESRGRRRFFEKTVCLGARLGQIRAKPRWG